MTFRDNLLKTVDRIRGDVPGRLGLRTWTVTVLVRMWSGKRVGQGGSDDTEYIVTNVHGYAPKVTSVTSKDVVASGGVYTSADYKIGPITPDYLTGGIPRSVLDPIDVGSPTEVYWKLSGRGFVDDGEVFKRIDSSDTQNFNTTIVVRKVAVKF